MLSFRSLTIPWMLSLVMVCTAVAGLPKPKSEGTIELIGLTPEDGSSVDRESTITAKLRYTIENFKDKKDRYQVSINFQKRESRAATFSTGPGAMVTLTEPTGTITLAYPLDAIWDDPRLQKPLVVYFFLHERTGRRESIVLDTTDRFSFSVRE